MPNLHENHLTLTLLFLTLLLSSCSTPSSSISSEESLISSQASEISISSELSSEEESSSLINTSEEESNQPVTSQHPSSEVVTTSEEPSISESSTSEGTSSVVYTWPGDVILAMFDGYTIPSYPLQAGDQLYYSSDEVNRMIGISIITSHVTAFDDYLAVLDTNTFHSYVNYLNHYAVSTNSGGNLNVYFNFNENVLTLTLLGVDYTYYESYFNTFIYSNNPSFPSTLIGQVYDETIGQIIPPYITSGSFSFYTRILVSKSNVVIKVRQSSEIEFSDYYFLLWDEDWYMEGLIMNHEYTARDSTNSVKLDVSYDGSTTVTISITLI